MTILVVIAWGIVALLITALFWAAFVLWTMGGCEETWWRIHHYNSDPDADDWIVACTRCGAML